MYVHLCVCALISVGALEIIVWHGVLSRVLYTYCCRQSLSLTSESSIISLDRLVFGNQGPSYLHPSAPGYRPMLLCLAFLIGAGDLTSGSPDCILSLELFLNSQ